MYKSFIIFLQTYYPEVYGSCLITDWTEYEGSEGRKSRIFDLEIYMEHHKSDRRMWMTDFFQSRRITFECPMETEFHRIMMGAKR